VKPPPSGPRKKAKEYPPLEAYLRHLLLVKLEPTDSSISMVTKQIIRFPWNDPAHQCGSLVCRIMLKACRNGRYKAIEAVASVAARLRTQRAAGETTIRLIDCLLEELRWALENPSFRDQQRTLTYSRLLGELYRTNQVPGRLIIDQLYDFLNIGHEIPEALRQVSKEIEAQKTQEQSSDDKLPVYNSASGVSAAIPEDEEMEETELETKMNEEPPKPVAVSQYSKYDPRVPSAIDPPNSSYRITLICTLLEVVARSLVSRNNLPRLKGFMASLQRYLFTKGALSTDVEFTLLDTFDILDSQWKRVTKISGKSSSAATNAANEHGFPRFDSWLDAHNATVAFEEADALFETQKRSRMDNAFDGDQKSLASTLDDVGSMVDDDEISGKSKDTVDDSADGLIGTGSFTDEVGREGWVSDEHDDDEDDDDDEDEDETTEDGSGESDDDDEESEEDDDDEEMEEDEEDEDVEEDEEFDEAVHLQRMEEQEFERELRRLTMDALEKGKSASRKLVGDSMISGSQVVKRKPTDIQKSDSCSGPAGFTLGGEAGISFQVLKRGNKGRVEAKELVVPVSTNLAAVASRQDDAAARERDVIKQRVLRYEEKSAEAEVSGGNVYLEQKELQRNRNKTLSMAEIDKNFGTTGGSLLPTQLEKKPSAAQIQHVHGGSRANPRGGRGRLALFGPGRGSSGSGTSGSGRGSSTGRGLFDF
jgi:regulator of nonsense transcripts 2